MINSFKTVFEAREDKFQIENFFHGETVDLVAKVTTDGVPNSLQYYTAKGMYQPSDTLSTDVWYPLSASLSGDCVIMHWTPANDLGCDSYIVYCLLEKPNETSYPLTWRINLEYSPGYPANPVQPIPQQIDFSQYDLLNAPWIEATETDTEWVVDKIIKVPGLDLDSLSVQNIVISGGSLFDAVSSVNQNITDLSSETNGKLDALSNDLSECCEGMNGKVDSLSTTLTSDFAETNAKIDAIDIPTDYAKEATLTNVSSDVASIKETVEAISIPTDYAKENSVSAVIDAIDQIVIPIDYAKEATVGSLSTSLGNSLESLSTHSDEISASLYGSVATVASTASRIESKVDAITIPTDYAKESTVNSLSVSIGNSIGATESALESLSTHSDQISASLHDSLEEVSSTALRIESKIDAISLPTDYAKEATVKALSGTIVLSANAIKDDTADIRSSVNDPMYGLVPIKTIVDNAASDASYAKAYAGDASSILNNGTYGNEALKSAINSVASSVNQIVIPSDYAKEASVSAVAAIANGISSIVGHSFYGNEATFNFLVGDYGLPIIKQHVDTIEGTVLHPGWGNQAIKNAINAITIPTDYATSASVNAVKTDTNAIKAKLDDGTYGLSALNAKLNQMSVDIDSAATDASIVNSTVNNGTYGNQALKNAIDAIDIPTIPTDYATSAQAQSIINNLTDGDYGLEAIKGTADDAFLAADEVWRIVNDDYTGNASIRDAIASIDIPTDYAKQNTLTATQTTVNDTNAKVNNATYGLSALQALLGDCAAALDIINGEVL